MFGRFGGGNFKTETDVFNQTFEGIALLEDELNENYDILMQKQSRLSMVYDIVQNDFGQFQLGSADLQVRMFYKAGTIITMKYDDIDDPFEEYRKYIEDKNKNIQNKIATMENEMLDCLEVMFEGIDIIEERRSIFYMKKDEMKQSLKYMNELEKKINKLERKKEKLECKKENTEGENSSEIRFPEIIEQKAELAQEKLNYFEINGTIFKMFAELSKDLENANKYIDEKTIEMTEKIIRSYSELMNDINTTWSDIVNKIPKRDENKEQKDANITSITNELKAKNGMNTSNSTNATNKNQPQKKPIEQMVTAEHRSIFNDVRLNVLKRQMQNCRPIVNPIVSQEETTTTSTVTQTKQENEIKEEEKMSIKEEYEKYLQDQPK